MADDRVHHVASIVCHFGAEYKKTGNLIIESIKRVIRANRGYRKGLCRGARLFCLFIWKRKDPCVSMSL